MRESSLYFLGFGRRPEDHGEEERGLDQRLEASAGFGATEERKAFRKNERPALRSANIQR
jgi:hypothetical protein